MRPLEGSDRANELIVARIAEQLGVQVEAHRDANGLHLVFSCGYRAVSSS